MILRAWPRLTITNTPVYQNRLGQLKRTHTPPFRTRVRSSIFAKDAVFYAPKMHKCIEIPWNIKFNFHSIYNFNPWKKITLINSSTTDLKREGLSFGTQFSSYLQTTVKIWLRSSTQSLWTDLLYSHRVLCLSKMRYF